MLDNIKTFQERNWSDKCRFGMNNETYCCQSLEQTLYKHVVDQIHIRAVCKMAKTSSNNKILDIYRVFHILQMNYVPVWSYFFVRFNTFCFGRWNIELIVLDYSTLLCLVNFYCRFKVNYDMPASLLSCLMYTFIL